MNTTKHDYSICYSLCVWQLLLKIKNRCFICVTYHETFMSLQTIIKEEDRLASAIAEIDEDVRIVPRAAFIKTPTGQVISNRSFEGQHHAKRQLLA